MFLTLERRSELNSRLYFDGFEVGAGYKKSAVVGLSVAVRPEVKGKLSRVDISLVMQSNVQVPEGTEIITLYGVKSVFLPREISVGVFSEDKKSGIYALVQSERVQFKPTADAVAYLEDRVPYVHSLYVPYRENLHVSAVAQLMVRPVHKVASFEHRRLGMPVELTCVADSGEVSDFDYEKWGDTDWD